MKPGKNVRVYSILITGRELEELKKHTCDMAESFGLDDRIDEYDGIQPIGLYQWDLDCLTDVIDAVLVDLSEYPDRTDPGYEALHRLGQRLRTIQGKG